MGDIRTQKVYEDRMTEFQKLALENIKSQMYSVFSLDLRELRDFVIKTIDIAISGDEHVERPSLPRGKEEEVYTCVSCRQKHGS